MDMWKKRGCIKCAFKDPKQLNDSLLISSGGLLLQACKSPPRKMGTYVISQDWKIGECCKQGVFCQSGSVYPDSSRGKIVVVDRSACPRRKAEVPFTQGSIATSSRTERVRLRPYPAALDMEQGDERPKQGHWSSTSTIQLPIGENSIT